MAFRFHYGLTGGQFQEAIEVCLRDGQTSPRMFRSSQLDDIKINNVCGGSGGGGGGILVFFTVYIWFEAQEVTLSSSSCFACQWYVYLRVGL